MSTRFLPLLPVFALFALPAAADNFYWSSTAANPGDWNAVANWRVGGDSEWDPVATTLPVVGTDTVTFRSGTHGVTAPGGATFGQIFFGDGNNPNAAVTFGGATSVFTADSNAGFMQAASGASFTLAGGSLLFNNREFYANSPATLRFQGNGTSVSDLKVLTFNSNADIRFTYGVRAQNITLTLCPFDGSGSGNNVLVSGSGTVVDGLTFAGRYWGSTMQVDGGAVVTNLLFQYGDQFWTADNPTWPETRFVAANATIVDLKFNNFVFTQPPNTSFVFGDGSRIIIDRTRWDPYSLVSSNGLLRVSGAGTTITNFNFLVTGLDGRLQITDGAKAFTRTFNLGYGASGVRGTVSGAGTVWTVSPNDMKQEGVVIVGFLNDGRGGTDCELVVEDGAHLVIDDTVAYKNNEKVTQLLGLLAGGPTGSDGNRILIRSGAVVSNWFATGIGGGFTSSSNARGGANNLLRIEGEGTEFRGGLVYNDIWDAELYLGWQTGYSNTVEVADGAVASFTGGANFGYGTAAGDNFVSGGGRISVDNATLSIDSKVDGPPATLQKGPHVLEVCGTNGTLRVGAIMQDAGCSTADWSYLLRFGIAAEGRSTEDPMLEVTGRMWDLNKDALIQGKITPVLDIPHAWAHSGRGHTITLVAVTGGEQFATGEQRWAHYRNGLQTLAGKVDPAQLGDCLLSVVVDREDPEIEWSTVQSVRLVLESGGTSGTMVLFR